MGYRTTSVAGLPAILPAAVRRLAHGCNACRSDHPSAQQPCHSSPLARRPLQFARCGRKDSASQGPGLFPKRWPLRVLLCGTMLEPKCRYGSKGTARDWWYEDQGADRRRRPGGANACYGFGLARHRCRRRRATTSERPTEREVGQIGARSMEIFRGSAWPRNRAASGCRGPSQRHRPATSVTGIELSRVLIPRAARVARLPWPGRRLPGRRRAHASLQSKVLRAGAVRARGGGARIRILDRTEKTGLARCEQGVTASAVDLDGGTCSTIECDYLVGCDGASCLCASRLPPSRRHPGAPVRTIFPCPGTATSSLPPGSRPGSTPAQSTPLRRDDGCRWARDLERTELFLSWRNRAGSP